jgi:hypothetical protein
LLKGATRSRVLDFDLADIDDVDDASRMFQGLFARHSATGTVLTARFDEGGRPTRGASAASVGPSTVLTNCGGARTDG